MRVHLPRSGAGQDSIARVLLIAVVLAAGLLALVQPAGATEVQRVTSPGGIEAWLVEDHSNPILALDLAFDGSGASQDPKGKAGLAGLLSSTMDEGAGPYDSQEFQGLLDNLSISLGFSAGLDSFSGKLTTLTKHRETAFRLLRLALTEPRFDAEPVERIRAQILNGITRQAEDPDAIANRTLRKLFFPEDAYGRPRQGTKASVQAIQSDDLRAFVGNHLARDRLVIGVVGDITADELAALLDSTFGALPPQGVPLADSLAPVAGAGETVVVVKDIPQSVVALGHRGIARDDPDYYIAYVVNQILGGSGFNSRLYEEVREKRGLAYSVYAYLSPLDRAALIGGGTATQNARVGESLDLIRQEWRRMAATGPTTEELALAKTFLTGSFPLRLSSSGAIAGMLVGMQMENLGIDYIDRRNDYITAVTLEDAKRVAQRIYHPDELTVVVVGQPEGIEPTREAPALVD